MDKLCRSTVGASIQLPLDLASLAHAYEGGGVGFCGGQIIPEMENLLNNPRAPLVLATVSYINFM